MKFLHSSDFHIASSFEYSSLPNEINIERRIDIWKSIEILMDEARKRNVDFILLSGDLYNEEFVTISDLNRLTNLFKSIKNINIFIIFGNHDPFKENSKWRFIEIPKNVYLFKDDFITKYEFTNYNIYGISYIDNALNNSELFKDLKIDKDKRNFLLIHTDLINSNFKYQPVKLDEMINISFDYIALGHLHKPLKITDNCYYSGSIEPLSFNEKDLHGVIYGEFINDKLNIEFLNISQSIFIEKEFILDGNFDYYKLKDEIINNWTYKNKKNYLRIILNGYIPEEYELDEEELIKELKEFVEYVEIINNLDTDLDLDRIQKLNENNIVGIFIENMLKKDMNDSINKEALRLGLKSLLRVNK